MFGDFLCLREDRCWFLASEAKKSFVGVVVSICGSRIRHGELHRPPPRSYASAGEDVFGDFLCLREDWC